MPHAPLSGHLRLRPRGAAPAGETDPIRSRQGIQPPKMRCTHSRERIHGWSPACECDQCADSSNSARWKAVCRNAVAATGTWDRFAPTPLFARVIGRRRLIGYIPKGRSLTIQRKRRSLLIDKTLLTLHRSGRAHAGIRGPLLVRLRAHLQMERSTVGDFLMS
jgi:hypothetical protein